MSKRIVELNHNEAFEFLMKPEEYRGSGVVP